MRVPLPSALFALFASGLSFGQAATSNCPKIEVIGPSGIVRHGEAMDFIARISTTGPKVSYQWRVEKGTITEGQGTHMIKVVGSEPGATITATVKIEGLPSGCDNTASELGQVDSFIGCGMPSDEWSELKPNEIRVRIDGFLVELINNPESLGVVLLTVKENETLESTNKRLQFFVKHATFRKFDLERIFFKMERSEDVRTRLWRVPPGAAMPCPECIEHRGVHLK